MYTYINMCVYVYIHNKKTVIHNHTYAIIHMLNKQLHTHTIIQTYIYTMSLFHTHSQTHREMQGKGEYEFIVNM